MEIYLLKSIACLAALFAFYKLFLERENMHTLKRFYLIGILLVSFVIPFITFTEYVVAEESSISIITSDMVLETPEETLFTIENLIHLLWGIYTIGVLFFGWRFINNLSVIVQKIRKNPRLKSKNLFHVLLQAPTTPHTFFSYIFLNRKNFESKEIPQEVLDHEEVHAQELHSLDILFIELLLVVFWFNPLLYYIKRSIKLNHEFLADRAVLKDGIDVAAYQNTILAFSSSACTPSLANSINYSFIKKRFTVMNKQTSKTALWLRSLLVLPLLALLLVGFSSKETVFIEDGDSPKEEVLQKKASQKEIDEYNALARKYNAMDKSKQRILLKDVERMKYLYDKMTSAQRSAAEPFPEFPAPPPPPPPLPEDATPAQVKKYKKAMDNYERAKKTAPSPPPPPPPSKVSKTKNLTLVKIPNNERKEMLAQYQKDGGEFYFNNKKISYFKALALVDELESYSFGFSRGPNQKPAIYINNVAKGQIPPPPPIPDDATPEQVKKYKKAIESYNKAMKKSGKVASAKSTDNIVVEGKLVKIQPSDVNLNLKVKPVDLRTDYNIEVSPTIKTNYDYKTKVKPDFSLRQNPLDHIVEMAKKGATFYSDDGKITSDEAIQLLKDNPKLHVQTRRYDSDHPSVHISKKPIVYKPDPVMDLTDLIKQGATFYYNDKKISTAKAKKLAKNTDKMARIEVVGGEDGKPIVYFWSKS